MGLKTSFSRWVRAVWLAGITKGMSGVRAGLIGMVTTFAAASVHAEVPGDWWVDIANDRAASVRRALHQGVDPNAISPGGNPAIMQAIREEAWDVYEALLADPRLVLNAINTHRETPLMYLAVMGETERARDLIRRGALVNRPGWTPLHYAASRARLDTARMLLEQGAEVNARAPDGATPLMMAAYAGSEAMVRLLLEHGGDARLTTVQDYDAADWAGFKAHTRLAGKLRDLIDGRVTVSEAALGAHAEAGPGHADDKDYKGVTSSSSSYFDLERFERQDSP